MRRSGVVLLLLAGILLSAGAQPGIAALTPAQDIVGISLTSDATQYFFHVQLAGAPSATDYAKTYGIYFIGGAPNPPGNRGEYFDNYVALTGQNIDAYSYVSNYQGSTPYPTVYGQYRGYLPNSTTFDSPNFDPMPTFSANGATLTWAINKDQLATGFSWLAATSINTTLLDKSTVASAVPIPNAIWLLGSGVVALVGLKRRKSSKV